MQIQNSSFYRSISGFTETAGGGVLQKSCFEIFANFAEKHLCQNPFLVKLLVVDLQLYQKEARTQLFPCEFCEIFQFKSVKTKIVIMLIKQTQNSVNFSKLYFFYLRFK